MIVKVQVDSTNTKCLIYDRDGTFIHEGPVPEDIKLGPFEKEYWVGVLSDKGTLILKHKTAPQEW